MLKNKNKFKIIALLAVIIFTLTLPIVRAEDEVSTDIINPEVTTTQTPDNTATMSDETFKKSDIYLTGDDVTIDYIIDGNLFVFANHVTINSQIGGDAFICANSVTIGDQGYVFSNLFTFSKDVTVNGVVYDLYAASQNTTINGYVYRDIHVGSNTINIYGTIGRNASVSCNTLNLENEKSSINGNLNYESKTEASIPEGVVAGEVTFEQEKSDETNPMLDLAIELGTYIVTVVAIWLLCLWLAPKFLKNNTSLLTTKKILPVILFGILTPLAFIIFIVLFFILGITSILGLLLLLLMIALFVISNAMFIITFNNILCSRLKIEKTMGIFGMLIVTSAVLWLVGLIPYVGRILGFIVLALGIGIAMSSLVLKEKEVKE